MKAPVRLLRVVRSFLVMWWYSSERAFFGLVALMLLSLFFEQNQVRLQVARTWRVNVYALLELVAAATGK